MNHIILIGRIATDPKVSNAEDDSKRTHAFFRLATAHRFKKADGEERTATDFHSVVAFNGLAHTCVHVVKGTEVAVHGRLTYSERNVKGTKVQTARIIADEIKFLRQAPNRDASGDGAQSW